MTNDQREIHRKKRIIRYAERTGNVHKTCRYFGWHVADSGMEHVYIKSRTPQLNGKVERWHRTDKDEFYRLLTYRDDADLDEPESLRYLKPASCLMVADGEHVTPSVLTNSQGGGGRSCRRLASGVDLLK